MESLVLKVLNDEQLLNIKHIKDFKQEEEFEDLMRPIKDEMTDIVNSQLLKYHNIENISIIFNAFNEMIQYFVKHMNLNNKDIVFCYKGGNALRYIALNYECSIDIMFMVEHFDNLFGKYFKQSDNDFTIFLNPHLDNYDYVVDRLTICGFLTLDAIRGVFLRFPEYAFDKNPIDEIFYLSDGTPTHVVEVSDNYIEFDEEKNVRVYEIEREKSYIRNSLNTALEFSQEAGKVHFNLVRSKIMFAYQNQAVGGELIDVSIPLRDDFNVQQHYGRNSKEFYEFIDENVSKPKELQDKDISPFYYRMININYIVEDLFQMLFIMLVDRKIEKRIYRLIYFLLLDFVYEKRMNDEKVNVADLLEFIKFLERDIRNMTNEGYADESLIDLVSEGDITELTMKFLLLLYSLTNDKPEYYNMYSEEILNLLNKLISTLKQVSPHESTRGNRGDIEDIYAFKNKCEK